ncbi:MAG: methyltransferase [Anaerolineae bacterium]|nr:methyltransferase [Anaerolineae bacterium]
MILLRSSLHTQLVEEIVGTRSNGNFRGLTHLLNTASVADGFLATIDPQVFSQFWEPGAPRSIKNWFVNIPTWLNGILDPRTKTDEVSSVLYYLWEHFSTHLVNSLHVARLRSGIPSCGGILAFVGGLKICLVLKYEFIGNQPRIRPVTIISDPQSVFDFWGAIDSASGSARNQLKQILVSGHKIIAHRNVLIHVDRSKDSDVFGPSIDTLVLAEILAQAIYEGNDKKRFKVAMEVGCGNGLLTVSLLKNLPSLTELFSIDAEFSAVACTARNLRNVKSNEMEHSLAVHLINGGFDPDLLNRKFDLIVCNPPYIPFINSGQIDKSLRVGDYITAVGGTDLCELLIKSSYDLLNPGGRLLIMTSSLILASVASWIPTGCNMEYALWPNGFEVLFDVEAVLSQPKWVEYLLKEHGLKKKKGMYFHTLYPVWIIRPDLVHEQNPIEFPGSSTVG